MSDEQLFEMVEVDVPRCSRVFGTAPCTAALGGSTVRKCWNLRASCADPANYLEGTPLTLRYSKDTIIPVGVSAFPALVSAKEQSTTVNIAGQNQNLGGLGRRATLSVTLADFTHDDVGIDPYQAERVSGAAQLSAVGYDVEANGTHLKRLKARWPYYASKDIRLIRGYVDPTTRVLSDTTTTNYHISEIDGPNDGRMNIKALDVLDLANEKTALCPKPSPGRLVANITNVETSFTVTPAGAGASYAASGRCVIGSEVMDFTRASDVFTVIRAVRNTTAAAHNLGETVQQTYTVSNQKLDAVATDLVLNFTTTPATYLDAGQQAIWATEVNTWGQGLSLTTDITTPTPVATLLAELGELGCTIWPDQIAKKLNLRMNRPLRNETARAVSDNTALSVENIDRDADRITQVLFFGARFNPTKSLTDDSNYATKMLTVSTEALALYGQVKSRKIYSRWIDQGDETTMSVVSTRLLRRFKDAPKTITLRLDNAEKAVALMDVIDLTSDELADQDGMPATKRLQVFQRSEPTPYVDVEVLCQMFDFTGRYGFIMADGAPVYTSATQAEKDTGAFIAEDVAPYFADNTDAYRII